MKGKQFTCLTAKIENVNISDLHDEDASWDTMTWEKCSSERNYNFEISVPVSLLDERTKKFHLRELYYYRKYRTPYFSDSEGDYGEIGSGYYAIEPSESTCFDEFDQLAKSLEKIKGSRVQLFIPRRRRIICEELDSGFYNNSLSHMCLDRSTHFQTVVFTEKSERAYLPLRMEVLQKLLNV